MKKLVLCISITVVLAGCAAGPSVTTVERPKSFASLNSISADLNLKAAIDRFLPDTLFPPSNIGIKIVSLTENETLYELNPRALFNPASNQKLFTTSGALTALGNSFLVSTVFTMDTATGSIGVHANGDPLLSTGDVDSIARTLARLLPRRESWTLSCDVSYFDDLFLGDGWTWDAEPAAYAAPITPLMLNSNTIKVTVTPGLLAGDTATVTTDPVTDYVSVENTAVMGRDTAAEPLMISRKWRDRSNVITVTGQMTDTVRQRSRWLSLWQPERYAATVIAERLSRHGVPIRAISVDTSRSSGIEILRYAHTLDSVVTYTNKVSDNLSAEAMLKIIGAEIYGPPGTAPKGLTWIKRYLASRDIDTSGIVLADGSGLSRYNLSSAEVITSLLAAMHRDREHFDLLYGSLPVAGADGTLENRMKGTAAEGNLRAKTGTLSGASALSGYVTTRDGEVLAFSMLMQHYPFSAWRYRKVQDNVGVFLAEFTRRYYQ